MKQPDLVKGRGIWVHNSLAGDGGRYGGRGTLLDTEDPIVHANVNRKPVTPGMEQNMEWNRMEWNEAPL